MSKEYNTPAEKLFGSKTRAKLLELFFANTTKSFYVREITRVIEEQINSVRRELMNMESIGVIRSETFDNKVYYTANMKHPYSHAFQEMFAPKKAVTVVKTQEIKSKAPNSLDEFVKPVSRYLRAMALFNRAPGQEGVDLLLVGDDKTKKLTRWAEVVEKKQGKPLNYVILGRDDYLYRKSVKDRFVMGILEDSEISEIYDPEEIIKVNPTEE